VEKPPALQIEPAFEWVTRTSLQSFRFLPQNLCRAHPVRAGEITRTSLQSLMNFLAYAFYFVLFDLHDCNLHTQDASFGIPSDTRAQDNYHANAYYEPVASSDTLNF
jgi:hypothetical protein